MESKPSSETLINIYQIACYDISKDGIFRGDSNLALIPLLTHSRRKAIPLISSAGEEKHNLTAYAAVYNRNKTKIRFSLNVLMQHDKSIYE